MLLEKYSFGIGDRFACEGIAQLKAIVKAKELGISITPVWNKSQREHLITGTSPESVRVEADNAVRALGWKDPYRVDADHIGLKNVDSFLATSDFFTLDVADFIDRKAEREDIEQFVNRYKRYIGVLKIPGIDEELEITESTIQAIGEKYILAVKEAGKIYTYIEDAKGRDNFITEVSMDEAAMPQTPVEMFFILGAISDEKIPVQTIAPKLTGRFNKGVDYAGDLKAFEKEFNNDLSVIKYAVREFGLPENLKLSIHSGSDKFSIYEPIREAIRRHDSGLHVKTAGTTWLEELIGLALGGGEGLNIAKDIYSKAYNRYDELCEPYSAVIDIDRKLLPHPNKVKKWDEEEFARALRHDKNCPDYNPHFRQLLHVGFKIAAEMGKSYLSALEEYRSIIEENVVENIFERHIKRIFL
ncbi:MAG: hypothetical protein DRP87_03835 [Spirochaetes bacterium]|nr:MAG: hypothetical protein DRP87_03835 [Spirochaetota bacterium]